MNQTNGAVRVPFFGNSLNNRTGEDDDEDDREDTEIYVRTVRYRRVVAGDEYRSADLSDTVDVFRSAAGDVLFLLDRCCTDRLCLFSYIFQKCAEALRRESEVPKCKIPCFRQKGCREEALGTEEYIPVL